MVRPLDPIGAVIGRWKTFAVCLILGVAAAIAYTYVAPRWYQALLTVVPAQPSQDSAAAALMSKLPINLESTSADVQRIEAVLTSNSVADAVIDKFNLGDVYSESHRENIRRALWRHCTTSVNRKSSVVSLTCEDQSPEQAMAMAEYFGEVGNQVFARVSASSAREERKFLESQVGSSRKRLDDTSLQLREFQEKHRIVDLPEQSKAVISAMAAIKGELIAKEMELSYLRSFSSGSEAGVQQLQRRITLMERQLVELEKSSTPAVSPGSGSAAAPSSFFPEAMLVPELRFRLEQLLRDQQIEQSVFFMLTQRLEMARVDEARDTSAFQILDHPTLPTYHARPRRMRSLVLGAFGGLLFAAALVFIPLWWKTRQV